MQATNPVFALKLCYDYAMHNSAAAYGYNTFREWLDDCNKDLSHEHIKMYWEVRRWFTGETIEEVFNPDRFILNDEPLSESIKVYKKLMRQLGGEFIYEHRNYGEKQTYYHGDSHIIREVRHLVTWELACQSHIERFQASDEGEAWKRWHHEGRKLSQEEITARFKEGKKIAIEDLPDYPITLRLDRPDKENGDDAKTTTGQDSGE